MRKILTMTGIFEVLMLFLIVRNSASDVLFPPTYYRESRAGASLEGLFCVERGLTQRSTRLFWIGVGCLRGLDSQSQVWRGYEGALGIRIYPISRNYDTIFAGIYAGCSFMEPLDHKNNSAGFGISFGTKIGYKLCVRVSDRTRLAIEPYTSLSFCPLNTDEGLDKHTLEHRFYTTGIRFVLEFIRGLEKR